MEEQKRFKDFAEEEGPLEDIFDNAQLLHCMKQAVTSLGITNPLEAKYGIQ